MNKPTYVAFSTQKGGAGKTTITVLVASYLHYVRGYDVAVVDCDFPQYSIHDMRRRDMDMTMKDDHYKAMAYEQFRRLDKKAYPVLCCKPEDAVATAEKLAGTGRPLNFVFFDLPGTINNPNIVKAIASMDYIFCPIVADRVVMTSSMQFATVINEHMISTGKTSIKGLYMLWNLFRLRKNLRGAGTPDTENLPTGQQAFPQGGRNGTQGGIPFDALSGGQVTCAR